MTSLFIPHGSSNKPTDHASPFGLALDAVLRDLPAPDPKRGAGKMFGMSTAAAERTAAFLLERVIARWGRLRDQGERSAVLGVGAGAGEALRLFARRRVRGVPEPVAAGLCAWSRGERPVDLLEEVPTAEQVLLLQARGRRCVSLISDDRARAHGDPRHPDGLSFALHDLCHVEKFVNPEHHLGQVGFFRAVAGALGSASFRQLQERFDQLWLSDRNYVIADMNGSAIFLFAVLKMKIKMAVRRHLGLSDGGPLTPPERAAFEPVVDTLVHALGLPGELREAAHLVSARREHPTLARRLLSHFERTGAAG